MKKILFILSLLILAKTQAHALAITSYGLTNTLINAETVGPQTGTTIQFTLDGGPSDVVISVFRTTNGTDNTLVTTINANALPAGANNVFWNGLWLISGDNGRDDGNYRFQIAASSIGAVSPTVTIVSLLQITSIDIHAIAIQSSFDANQLAAPPYTIAYFLAKNSLVTSRIRNTSGTVVRTLALNIAGVGESLDVSTGVPNFLTWDGLGDDGHPVANGIYSLSLDATDPSNSDHAITRTRTLALQSVADASANAQQLFESNAFIFPNPVRNGAATIQMQAIRDGATLSLKIYTITGTLVRDEHFNNVSAGNIVTFNWDVTNESGHKLGRGLYYYVVREQDNEGTLQTIKKMAVIP